MEAVLHKLDASGFRPRGYYAPGLDEGVPSRGGMHELMAMCQAPWCSDPAADRPRLPDNREDQ
jgi:hypothetical protein